MLCSGFPTDPQHYNILGSVALCSCSFLYPTGSYSVFKDFHAVLTILNEEEAQQLPFQACAASFVSRLPVSYWNHCPFLRYLLIVKIITVTFLLRLLHSILEVVLFPVRKWCLFDSFISWGDHSLSVSLPFSILLQLYLFHLHPCQVCTQQKREGHHYMCTIPTAFFSLYSCQNVNARML